MGRITYQKKYASGKRGSWARTVEGLVDGKKFAHGIAGRYLNEDQETDIEDGTLIVEITHAGSVKNSEEIAALYRVQGSDLHALFWTYDWRKQQLSLRDKIQELLDEGVEPKNPLDDYSDEDLLAEVKRRGLTL